LNSKNSGRRGLEDEEWKKVKEFVRKRDKNSCRLLACLSPVEAVSIEPGFPSMLDCAHVFAASTRPDLIYTPNNVVLLRRFVHSRMDNYIDPVTARYIDLNFHYYWWHRILTKKVAPYDATLDYESMTLKLVLL